MQKFPYYKQLDAMDCGPTTACGWWPNIMAKTTACNICAANVILREGISMLGYSEAISTPTIHLNGYGRM